MSNDNLFFKSDKFGSLYYHNVYSYYDEPIIFTAKNDYEQLFFCYSLGFEDIHDQWVITPTSQDRVNKLEQKDISIIDMIKPLRNHDILYITINIENNTIYEEFKNIKKLSCEWPSNNIFIRENINYDGTRKHSHRIRIAKKSGENIVSETLNKISETFSEFCKHYLKKHDISVSFYPRDAVIGSFVYRVKAKSKNIDDFKINGYDLLSKIENKNSFLDSVSNKEIDLRIVRKLFSLIGNDEITIELFDEESTNNILKLTPDYIKKILPIVDEKVGHYLDSTMVPQADNLDRIKKYIDLVYSKKIVTPDELGVTKRQVSYYQDACKILSLINDYYFLTPNGIKIAQSENSHEWMTIVQKQFEESDCGYLWMKNQNVKSIIEINESSSGQFLIDNCNGLSEQTSLRRATTLKSWVKKFKDNQT